MRQLALALVMVVAGSAFAQEIGTEITPTTPSSGVQQQPQNNSPPPPQDQPKSGYVYKPKGAKDESVGSPGAAGFSGTKVSGSSGDFGIRAGFGASGSAALPAGTSGGATVAAPSVGIAYFATDGFKLLVDLGFGMALIGSSALFALSATAGFDYLFRTPAEALRPFFHFAGSFNMAGSSNFAIGFGAQLGVGAEYFFSPSFSVNGRLLLAVPMSVNGQFALGIFTVAPGVGATFYL